MTDIYEPVENLLRRFLRIANLLPWLFVWEEKSPTG